MRISQPKYHWICYGNRHSSKILAALKYLSKDIKDVKVPKDRYSREKILRKTLSSFYPGIKVIGEGVYRKVFRLNKRVIVKMTLATNCSSNTCELKAFLKYPSLSTNPIACYSYKGLNLIFCERVEKIFKSYKLINGKYEDRFEQLSSTFRDMHCYNVGVLRGQLVALDAGCGLIQGRKKCREK